MKEASNIFHSAVRPVTFAAISLSLCLPLGMFGAAVAQEPQPGETVTDRARPELDPLGVRMGGFLFFPQLGIAEQYDDNIFSTDTGEIDDYITVISPSLQLRSNWNNHALNFLVAADAGFYSDNNAENYTDFIVGTDGRLDASRDTSFSLAGAYSRKHEDRGSVDDASGFEPTLYTILSPEIGFSERFGRFTLRVDGSLQRYDFDDVTVPALVNNDDRDRDEREGTLRLGFEIVPEYEMFVRGTYFDRAYEATFDDNTFERSSNGYEAVLGTAIDFTGVTFGEVFVGYRSQSPDDPLFDKIEGVQYGGAITWNPSGLTTVKGSVERTVEETTLDNASGFFATRGGLSVDHELLRSLILGINANYTAEEYKEIIRDDRIMRAGIYGKYLLNRHLYISVTYDYTNRSSDNPNDDFVKNQFMFRLQTQY